MNPPVGNYHFVPQFLTLLKNSRTSFLVCSSETYSSSPFFISVKEILGEIECCGKKRHACTVQTWLGTCNSEETCCLEQTRTLSIQLGGWTKNWQNSSSTSIIYCGVFVLTRTIEAQKHPVHAGNNRKTWLWNPFLENCPTRNNGNCLTGRML